jgi:hypothetical protein
MKINSVLIPAFFLTVLFISSCQKDFNQSPAGALQKNNSDLALHPESGLLFTDVKKTIPTGLVVWYPFLGNANDASGNGHDAYVDSEIPYPYTDTIHRLPVLTNDKYGHPNSAYEFTGTSDMWINSVFDVPVSQFSFYVRFKSNAHGTLLSTGNSYFDPRYDSGATSLSVASDNSISFYWQEALSSEGYAFPTSAVSCGPITVPPNSWLDVVVNFSGSTLTLYVNGRLLASNASSFSTGILGGVQVIGSRFSRHLMNSLNGTIDEIREYDRPLTTKEIKYLLIHKKF